LSVQVTSFVLDFSSDVLTQDCMSKYFDPLMYISKSRQGFTFKLWVRFRVSV